MPSRATTLDLTPTAAYFRTVTGEALSPQATNKDETGPLHYYRWAREAIPG